MKNRILSLFLALVVFLGILPTASYAADTPEDALGEVDIFNGDHEIAYLSINGAVRSQKYTYYNYTTPEGWVRETPAYCVNPNLYGVPQTVGPGESIKYIANEKASDPKVIGIICNGYPHYSLSALNLDDKYQAYYATKMALWCYLMPGWNINNLKIAPGLSESDQEIAKRVLDAATKIYKAGTTYNYMLEPKLTATPDRSVAYPVTVDGRQYKQQVFTIQSETFVYDYEVKVAFSDPSSVPSGTRIVNMDNQDITAVITDGNKGQFKVLYPVDSIEGETGSVQLTLNAAVAKYAVMYAICAQKDQYGNLQNYICDIDNNAKLEVAAISNYFDSPDEDPPDETSLRIIKLEEGTEIPLEGAVFSVYDPEGKKFGSYSTNANGIVTIPVTLEGHYTVTEEIPPEYHLLPNIRTQHADVEYGKMATVTFTNAPYGSLKVQKLSDTGEALNGVTVQIKHIDSGEVITGTTQIGGAVVFDKLKPGAYEVKETAGISGWIAETDTIQTVTVLAGKTSDVTIINKELPGLRIIKFDRTGHTVMEGVTFAVYRDGTFLGNYTTDPMGEILITEAEPGTYRVYEVDTGDTGHVLDTTPQEIELKAGDGILELVFFNSLKPGIKLVKVDSVTMQSLPNVRFEFKKVGGSYRQEFTTDINGEIDLSELEPGAYEVRELEAPDGYLIDDAVRVVQINPDENANFVFTNTPKPSLQLIKTSSDGTRLAGVHFRIAKIEDGSHYLDRITDGNGEINISDLEPGVYSVRETATVADHVLDLREFHVELFPGKTSTITIENQKRPNLIICKTDKDTGEPIAGVTFTLRGADGPTITTEPTGPDGTVTISNLLPGVYVVSEQNVPENYILDTTPQTVTLFPNRTAMVQFQNYKRPTLTISKVDINGRFLTGAIFEVKTKAGVKIGDFPVGPDGKITVPNIHLDEGYYIIREIQAPEGYILDSTPHEVYLRPGKTTEVSIENEKKPGLTIYKIDSVVGDGIKGAKFKIYVAKDMNPNGTYQELDSSFYYTDSNGIIHLDNLDTGWYKIVEVEPAAGFSMKEPHEQIIYVEHDKSAEVTFENTPLNAIIVEKYDSVTHEALPGCTFRLRYLAGTSGTGGTVIGTQVTSKNGTIIWTGLKPGAYVVEEIDPADGYSIINSSETVYLADSGEQSVITVIFTNSPDGSLLIRKVCAVNPGTTLQDAEFKIVYSDGTLIGDSNGIYRTDVNGEILIDGLKPGKSVVVTETKAPAGFLIDTQSQTIQIKEGRTVSLTFKNQPMGSLIIQKRDSITGQPLPGAEFRVTTAAGCEVGLDGVIGTATLTQNGLFTTDSNGEIRISNLAPGALVVTEVRAPNGYVMDSPSTNVVIGTNGDTQTVVITNTPKGGLLIRKIDSVTGKALPGVKFKIVAANGELVPDNEGQTSSNGIYTTDENGQIYLQKLNPNTYVVTEIETVDGYLLDAMPQTVVVSEADTQVLTFTNMPLGGLLVKKMDSATKEPLADVIFKITRTDGTVVGNSNGEYRTDERGYISLPDLEPGSYIVREVQAKMGYLLDDTPHAVEIKDHQTYTLEVFNQPLGNLIINKLSSADNSPLEGVKFQIKYANGQVVDNKNGQVSSNGIYYTDRNGQIILSGITGTVVVTELETLPGYTIDPNTRTQTVVINPNDTQTINFYNTPTTTLIIRKFIEGTENEPLSGVAFRVVDGAGAAVGPDDGLYYTDKSGEIVLAGIEPGTVVIVREVKTVEGYVLDGTPQDIKIEAGHVQQLTFWNKKAGTLVIQKKDSVSSALIAGAQFQLTYANGGYVDNDNGHLSSNGLYTTDATGEIRITGITGTVVCKEVQAAPGYVIDSSTQTQTVTVNPMDTQTLTFLNDPLCSLTLTKLDSVSGKPVPNTEFTVKDGNGNVVGKYVTGADGTVVVTGLIPGNTYVVYESRVPDGYVLNQTPQYITVSNGTGNSWTSGGTSTGTGNGNDLTFTNDPTMTLTVHKYIEGTANEPLAGVAFKIVDGSGAPLNPDGGVYYTNSAGEIVLEGLEPGTTITAQEIKTVDGYVLDGRPQSIKIEAGAAQNLTFWNKPAGSLIIRKLDKLTGKPLAGVEFEAMYAEGGYVDTANGHLSSNGLYYTDDHGEIHISGIVGTIVVKETRPLPGYTIEPGREQQIVTVNPQETQTLTFYNIPANTLTIQKYIDGTNNEPLAGVEFLVTNSSGAVVGPNNGYYTTDKDGRISIPGLTPGTSITVRETKTVDGYVLDGNPQTIIIKEGEAQTVTFWNKKAGGLIVNKVDAVTKEPLAGVKFRITYADGSNVDMDGGKISSNGIYTTDSTGQIKILGIVGTVIVEEIETIPGYIIDPNAKSQTVQINPNDTQTITFTNAPKQTLIIQKLVTGTKDQPLAGVEFLVTDSSGATLGPNNGIYRTDAQGRITITDLTPGTVITAKETKTLDGYVLDGTPQSMEIKSGEVQTLTFYNSPVGGLELIKVSESDKTQRIPNTTFEIRKMDGALVETVTTGKNGRVHVSLDAGDYYAVEIEAAQGFKLDNTPHYFTIQDNKTTTVTITNKPFSGILIHKVDSTTKKGIYGVTFLLYDSTMTPVGQYTSDDQGFVYIENLTTNGRYYLRELENEGYVVDTQYKTVYVKAGETTLVEWENTPITGQIQITKTSAEYNSMNGWPAGTPIPGTVFEIYHYRTGNLVDTIRTDRNGVAVSRPLPLGRYKVVESQAADFYGLDKTPIEVEIEYAGQIVKAAMTNKSLSTNVAIQKTGYAEVMPGQNIRYTFSGISNNSTTALTSFYWRDTLPVEAVRLAKVTTGTYNAAGSYKIVYKTNLSGSEYRVLADSLNTQQNYVLDASPVALRLASNEYVTEVMFVFGVVPANFRQVETPLIDCTVVSWVKGGSQFANQADVGGVYNGQWIMATTRWVTTVYAPPTTLPRTGY